MLKYLGRAISSSKDKGRGDGFSNHGSGLDHVQIPPNNTRKWNRELDDLHIIIPLMKLGVISFGLILEMGSGNRMSD